MKTIYHMDSSARVIGSHGRSLAKELVSQLEKQVESTVVYRDISQGLEFLTPAAIDGLYIPDETRTVEQKEALKLSNQIVAEMVKADYVVLSAPVYNFGPPASLKAWADLVARKGLTFTYTTEGPKGLLNDKKAFVVITSGGVPVGSPYDHLSPWIKTFLGFIGITDVTVLAADQLVAKESEAIQKVRLQIKSIVEMEGRENETESNQAFEAVDVSMVGA